MSSKGVLVIVSGPSGAGKGTVVAKAVDCAPQYDENLYLSVSMTSRSRRGSEVEGESYFFVTADHFRDAIEKGELIEYNCFSGNYYGTPKSNVDKHLENGESVILEIDVNGGDQIVEKYPDAVRVFIMPPSLSILEQRLRSRGRDTDEDIARRLGEAEREIRKSVEYDYIIVNDALDDAVQSLLCIIKAETNKTQRNKQIIDEVLEVK
ncbi:MAG: guanylate kinase [Clostridia bacterium]|nr:guanylate kinase [Clostridia bacterium]